MVLRLKIRTFLCQFFLQKVVIKSSHLLSLQNAFFLETVKLNGPNRSLSCIQPHITLPKIRFDHLPTF